MDNAYLEHSPVRDDYDPRSLGITFAICTAAVLATVVLFYLMWVVME